MANVINPVASQNLFASICCVLGKESNGTFLFLVVLESSSDINISLLKDLNKFLLLWHLNSLQVKAKSVELYTNLIFFIMGNLLGFSKRAYIRF